MPAKKNLTFDFFKQYFAKNRGKKGKSTEKVMKKYEKVQQSTEKLRQKYEKVSREVSEKCNKVGE